MELKDKIYEFISTYFVEVDTPSMELQEITKSLRERTSIECSDYQIVRELIKLGIKSQPAYSSKYKQSRRLYKLARR